MRARWMFGRPAALDRVRAAGAEEVGGVSMSVAAAAASGPGFCHTTVCSRAPSCDISESLESLSCECVPGGARATAAAAPVPAINPDQRSDGCVPSVEAGAGAGWCCGRRAGTLCGPAKSATSIAALYGVAILAVIAAGAGAVLAGCGLRLFILEAVELSTSTVAELCACGTRWPVGAVAAAAAAGAGGAGAGAGTGAGTGVAAEEAGVVGAGGCCSVLAAFLALI